MQQGFCFLLTRCATLGKGGITGGCANHSSKVTVRPRPWTKRRATGKSTAEGWSLFRETIFKQNERTSTDEDAGGANAMTKYVLDYFP